MNLSTECLQASQVDSLLQGNLTPEEYESAQDHLELCESCRARVEATIGPEQWWSDVQSVLLNSRTGSSSQRNASSSDAEPNEPSAAKLLDLLGPTDDPNMLGRIGPYEIIGLLGQGGMGAVFKGFDRSLNRFVAIKMLLPHLAASGAARKRFAREGQAVAAVVDDHVMAIHCVDEWQGVPYLVMTYSRGVSLQKRLSDNGPLEVREILRIGMQAAKGLAAAHAQGIVHRDIKPANIFLDQNVERVQLMDFGLARAVDDASLTRSGTLAGTPQYMSPEQARAEAVDHRSDLFSLGSVMYAMCTGHAPFRAESSYSILRLITDKEPRPIRKVNPDVPEWLCMLISRLMSKSLDDRYANALEVAELLERCLAHVQQPTSATLPASLLPQATTGRSVFNVTRTGVMTMLGILGMTLLGMVLWQATVPPDTSGHPQRVLSVSQVLKEGPALEKSQEIVGVRFRVAAASPETYISGDRQELRWVFSSEKKPYESHPLAFTVSVTTKVLEELAVNDLRSLNVSSLVEDRGHLQDAAEQISKYFEGKIIEVKGSVESIHPTLDSGDTGKFPCYAIRVNDLEQIKEVQTVALTVSEPDKPSPNGDPRSPTNIVDRVDSGQSTHLMKPVTKENSEYRVTLLGITREVSAEFTESEKLPGESQPVAWMRAIAMIERLDNVDGPYGFEAQVTDGLKQTRKLKIRSTSELDLNSRDLASKISPIAVPKVSTSARGKIYMFTIYGEFQASDIATLRFQFGRPGQQELVFEDVKIPSIEKEANPNSIGLPPLTSSSMPNLNPAADPADDHVRLQGAWQSLDSKELPVMPGGRNQFSVSFLTDRMSMSAPQRAGTGTFSLSPDTVPKQIDCRLTFGDKHIELKGIYEFHDSQLWLCLTEGELRPKSFDNPPTVAGLMTFAMERKQVELPDADSNASLALSDWSQSQNGAGVFTTYTLSIPGIETISQGLAAGGPAVKEFSEVPGFPGKVFTLRYFLPNLSPRGMAFVAGTSFQSSLDLIELAKVAEHKRLVKVFSYPDSATGASDPIGAVPVNRPVETPEVEPMESSLKISILKAGENQADWLKEIDATGEIIYGYEVVVKNANISAPPAGDAAKAAPAESPLLVDARKALQTCQNSLSWKQKFDMRVTNSYVHSQVGKVTIESRVRRDAPRMVESSLQTFDDKPKDHIRLDNWRLDDGEMFIGRTTTVGQKKLTGLMTIKGRQKASWRMFESSSSFAMEGHFPGNQGRTLMELLIESMQPDVRMEKIGDHDCLRISDRNDWGTMTVWIDAGPSRRLRQCESFKERGNRFADGRVGEDKDTADLESFSYFVEDIQYKLIDGIDIAVSCRVRSTSIPNGGIKQEISTEYKRTEIHLRPDFGTNNPFVGDFDNGARINDSDAFDRDTAFRWQDGKLITLPNPKKSISDESKVPTNLQR